MNQETKERLLGWKSQQSQFLFFQKNSILQQLQSLETEESNLLDFIEKHENKIKIKNYAIQILELLKEHKLKSRKDTILNIINTALKDIFDDAIYIDIEQEVNKNGRVKYNIVFYQQGITIAKNDELLESNGGGILAVISILFKILIGYLYSKNRLYIFDESFAQVSPQYRERLSLFMRQFAEKYNFTIILVSQTNDLNKFAHIEYNVNYKYDSKNIKELYIENINENRDEVKDKLDLYELEIKNFQSIKHIKFLYQGFTVISGPNNSGKSASLRAFKSILFNDFKEKFQRMNTKVTELVLKKLLNNKIQAEIKLIYKSKKVIFELNGEQYLGKNLAADILKSYIEKNFGLKFIDIKSLYKNIKGDLRKQVENIAYNSQHDSLFLIGSKSNEIEKVFNFLFNTETITMAISQFKEEIYNINDLLKDQKLRLEEIKYKIKDLQFELEYLDTLYNQKIIEEFLFTQENYLNIKNNLENIKNNLENIKNFKTNLSNYKAWVDYINSFFTNKNLFEKNKVELSNIKVNLNFINDKIKEIEEKITKIKNLNDQIKFIDQMLNQEIEIENKLSNINLKLDKILTFKNQNIIYKNLEDLYLKYINIVNYINNFYSIIEQQEKNKKLINQIKLNLENIKIDQENEFNNLGIIKCLCCNGLGYHKK